ncbi:sugar transferase [Spirosoma agri]|uniref:Sugar transferase n=1 Tax=Spirosoma agri TaxID=1987381 RepID=A0A6M0IRB5_9BACT|nr:sugar transferase [Spirosoma agri]NEU69911.1 sugar transferase [Spirosoma agri]
MVLDPLPIKARVKPPFVVGSAAHTGKRAFDLVVASLVTLLLLSWLIPLISLAIVLTSRGPALFMQTRSGQHGRHFTCFKFRTMHWSDGNDPFRQASRNDTRVTPIGRLLRRTNIDELPQFLNVLLGHMSIVGPRPHPIQLDAEFWFSMPDYPSRYQVRPGITGLAQARGCRGETSSPLKMKHRLLYDRFYIRKASVLLDFSICLRTLVTMLTGNTDAF